MPIETEPRRRDYEKIGLLCYWMLLALAAVVILAATWAGLSGTMSVYSQTAADMVLSDAMWYQDAETPYVTGFFKGPSVRSGSPLLIHQDHFGRLRLARTIRNNTEVRSTLPAPPVGSHTVIVRGIPYGSMAFRQYRATMRIVADSEAVYMLDAGLLADIQRTDPQTASRIVRKLAGLGQPALVFRGQPGALGDELAQYEDIPHIFSLRINQRKFRDIVHRATVTLRRHRETSQGTYRKPYVITGDVETAVSTANRNHFTHLVCGGEAPSEMPELVRVHSSAANLEKHLMFIGRKP